jgi:hypothetical protein
VVTAAPIRTVLIGVTYCLLSIGSLTSPYGYAAENDSPWHYQTYADAGYVASNRNPSDDEWRSKSSTAVLNDPQLFLVMGNIRKDPVADSRWGVEFGMQAGADSERLVTAPPPAANEPVSNADTLRHFYRANASWLFGDNQAIRLTGGLINSYIGYESYLAIDNPNYTRGYLLDTVPYFLTGLEAVWTVSETVDLGFYLVDGYNYLTDPNDIPSTGFQARWKISPRTTFTQNLYYGSEQANTNIDYWRFFSDTIIEWKRDRFVLAAALDYGTERQADLPGEPRFQWGAGAIWLRWALDDRMSFAFRPEIYWDDDGLITGAQQFIQAYTGTFKYQLSPRHQRLVGTFELRYDRSTGDEGGFFDSPDDRLVPDQTLVLVGLLWSFE